MKLNGVVLLEDCNTIVALTIDTFSIEIWEYDGQKGIKGNKEIQ